MLAAAAIAQDRRKGQPGQQAAGGGESTGSVSAEQRSDTDGLLGKKADKKSARPRTTSLPSPVLSAENEAAALQFVSENHQELSGLLERLKTSSPEEYKRALRELFRTSEKLAQTKSLDGERYDIELESWKADSEIRLLAAKLTMGESQELKGKLRNQLVRKNKLQLQRLELEKRRVEQRLKKLEESIAKANKEQDQLADRQMEELLRNVRQPAKKARPAAAVSTSDKAARDKGSNVKGSNAKGSADR
jgi:hypothetical protein